MKVVKANEMSRIEQLAYQEGFSEETFMENAGHCVAALIRQLIGRYHLKPNIAFLCGRGNNGGDAYVAARLLLLGGFEIVTYALAPLEQCSRLCVLQAENFQKNGGKIVFVNDVDEISLINIHLIVDGILGTGFHGNVEGLFAAAIEKANSSGKPILAIDIPSGINGSTGEIGNLAIKATDTLFLGMAKTGCFLGNVWDYVGKVHVHNFGLSETFIHEAQADFQIIDQKLIQHLLPKIERTRHKYQAGYVVGLGGSIGMPGAPKMTAFATLKAGAGIVRLLHPKGMEAELAGPPYEIILQGYSEGDHESVLQTIERASAVFIGPGLGTSSAALEILKQILPQLQKPCILDAECLTLLAMHPIQLPKECIMTPHHGEMKRLLGLEKDISANEFLQLAKNYAETHKVTLVLKGAPTFIFHPDTLPFVCVHGDPGMATAGSGDVLTGIISGFLAQNKKPLEAAILGVYFHGLAGEYAAEKYTSYSMVATDILKSLPGVFKKFRQVWDI